jgi:PhnB protein
VKIVTYLSFDGNCRDAFQYYQKVLGGEITDMISHGDMGIDMGDPDLQDRIMHARLVVDGQEIMGGDRPPGATSTPQGFSVSLHLNTDAQTEHVYNALSEGGTILMPLDKTEWSSNFAMLTDKFGTPWILNSTENAPQI